MSEPVKRGRGRPRKTEPVQTTPTNPDCEPATKGYVKCVARTLVDKIGDAVGTSHEGEGLLSIVIGGFLFVCYCFAMTAKTEPIAAWACGVGALAMLSAWGEILIHDHKLISHQNQDTMPHIQKYTPVCEEKKECE